MRKNIIGQEKLVGQVEKVIKIFKGSNGEIKPHFILTGPSGSSKTFTIKNLTQEYGLGYVEINAAQLTKEGTSGNSLSKALTPLLRKQGELTVVFVDEFDKLYLSTDHNNSVAPETTVGVQNEFLKVLEGNVASVFGDYGKYHEISIDNVLFIFAGAFNGEENIDLDRLREIGLKTEFLGRVGIIFNSTKLSLSDMYEIVDNSPLLKQYGELVNDVDIEEVSTLIKGYIEDNYDNNTIGARMVNTLVHQYFINGSLPEKVAKQSTFQNKITL